jgi:hypothetical protein
MKYLVIKVFISGSSYYVQEYNHIALHIENAKTFNNMEEVLSFMKNYYDKGITFKTEEIWKL